MSPPARKSPGKGPERRRPGRPGPDDPEVVLDVEFENGLLWLVLANTGPAVARDVRVDFRGKLRGVGGEVDVASLAVFRGLPLLRPGKDLRVFLDSAELLFCRRQSRKVVARVTWSARDGRRLGETFTHDLEVWRDFGEVRGPP